MWLIEVLLIHGARACALRGPNTRLLLEFDRELHGDVQLVVAPSGDYVSVSIRLRFMKQ